jgi:hypothetical protein
MLGPGGPVADTDIDLLDPITGDSKAITGDHANAAGPIATIAPIGQWYVKLDAPQSSLAAAIRLANVPIVGPITVTVPMATKVLRLDVTGVGIQTIAQDCSRAPRRGPRRRRTRLSSRSASTRCSST